MPRRKSSPKQVGCLIHKTKKGVRCHKGTGVTDAKCYVRPSGRCAVKPSYAKYVKANTAQPKKSSVAKHMKFDVESETKGCALVSKGKRNHCTPYSGPNDERCKRSPKGRCVLATKRSSKKKSPVKGKHEVFSLSSSSSLPTLFSSSPSPVKGKHMKFSLSSSPSPLLRLASPSSSRSSVRGKHMKFSLSPSSSSHEGCTFVDKGKLGQCVPHDGPNDERCTRSSRGRCVKVFRGF